MIIKGDVVFDELTDYSLVTEITGACEQGTRRFCEQQVLKPTYSVKEVIDLTMGSYGSEKFRKFFAK